MALSTIVDMESPSFSRLRTVLGLMPILGLAAMSCTITADITPNLGAAETEQSDDETGEESGVRSSDGTKDSGSDGTDETDGTGETKDSGGATGDGSSTGDVSDPGVDTTASASLSSDETNMTSMGTVTTSDTTSECAKVEANFTAVIPSIYILVDRSGSMNWGVDGKKPVPAYQSRWEIVERTLVEEGDLLDPDSGGVVYRMQSKAKFALATYTNNSKCPEMHYSETGATDYLPKLDNWSAVRNRLAAKGPGGGTPSSEAIDSVWRKMKASKDPNRILVFASDGDPSYGNGTGCPGYDFSPGVTASNPYHRVVEVVEEMYKDNIKTFVIMVGSAAQASGMDAIARAGLGVVPGMNEDDAGYPENPNEGEGKSARYFFAGTDAKKIESAFEAVITGARPCKFELEGRLSALGSTGEVLVNGNPKVLNDPDGWRINSLTEIELLGDACKEIRTDPNVDLKVSFSCEAFQPG